MIAEFDHLTEKEKLLFAAGLLEGEGLNRLLEEAGITRLAVEMYGRLAELVDAI